MAEIAVVVGVSDSGELKEAAKAYWSIAQDAVEALKEFDESEVPEDFELPEPAKAETSDGVVYSWAAPTRQSSTTKSRWLLPLADIVAAMASSPAMAERILTETPWEEFAVGDAEEPRAVAAGLDFRH